MKSADLTSTYSGNNHYARGSNQTKVRAYNERLVLTLIRQNGPMAKAEIARATGLSAQTVSVITRALEADKLLQKETPIRGKIGQPSVPMSLNKEGAFFLGLKVGRRSLDLVITDFTGAIRARINKRHSYPSPAAVIEFTHMAIERLLNNLTNEERDRVAGLGIAIPFRLWEWAKALGLDPKDMEDWKTEDIAEKISQKWDFPIYLQNDASAACGAELVFGAQDRPRDFLYFFIGFFIGGGLVLDDSLYTGKTGNAAAMGPLPIRKSNGTTISLMDLASLVRLEQAVIEAGGIAETIWENTQNWDIDPALVDTWITATVSALVEGIIAASCIIDFECVMVEGWLPEDIRARIVAGVNAKLQGVVAPGIDLPTARAGTIGSDARALGGASLPLSDRFLIDRNGFVNR